MNQYMFLYPVEEYFNNIILSKKFYKNKFEIGELFDIIDARYRENDYEINWLTFSREDNENEPDLSKIPNYVRINEDDRIINAGISFENHTKNKRYADPDYVIDQLPDYHERLVLGGFHQYDCVNKIAKKSYERGTETFVDEDTTELFFPRKFLYGIPLTREKWSLRELGTRSFMIDEAKKYRKNKPWFVQE